MGDVFELLGKGQLADLDATLEAYPDLAASRHSSGASLLAWAYYVGQPDAAALIRPRLSELDPHDAIITGDAERVREALTAGWDANALSPDGFTPLGLAAFFNRPEIFDLLLPVTRDVDEPAQNPQKVAALHAATAVRNAAMVEKLLRAGAKPDQRQADGFTPLQAAAQHGDAMTAGLLVLFGADPRLANDKGQDAIAVARTAGHQWLAERLERLQAPA
jgi:ankyrin repeat protein